MAVFASILPRLDHSNSLRLNTMQLVLSSGFINVNIFSLTSLLVTGCPLTLVSSTDLDLFPITVCVHNCLSLSFILTPLSSVFHLSVSYGERYFTYSAPSVRNPHTQHVRSLDDVSTFRSRNKTHLSILPINSLKLSGCFFSILSHLCS